MLIRHLLECVLWIDFFCALSSRWVRSFTLHISSSHTAFRTYQNTWSRGELLELITEICIKKRVLEVHRVLFTYYVIIPNNVCTVIATVIHPLRLISIPKKISVLIEQAFFVFEQIPHFEAHFYQFLRYFRLYMSSQWLSVGFKFYFCSVYSISIIYECIAYKHCF